MFQNLEASCPFLVCVELGEELRFDNR